VSSLSVNTINIVLVVLSCVAAFMLPFELFLFSYAVLGPLHYLTQISWMHDRRYFTSAGSRGDSLFLAGLALCVGSISLGLPQLSDYNPSIAFVAFGTALLMILAKQTRTKVIGALVLLGLSFLMRRWDHFGLTFGAFLPTVIHVCLFTACFVLVGAMKSRDWSGVGLLGVYSICAASCFLFVPESSYVISEAAHEQYTQDFYGLNNSLSFLFFGRVFTGISEVFASEQGLMIARFIAFSYTYHYLNWFSKTSVIRWHEVPRSRLIGCFGIWLASLALYAYDFRSGVSALLLLSLTHVYLEFPLNHRTFMAIGTELGTLLNPRQRA
jgi:hypothetical protein